MLCKLASRQSETKFPLDGYDITKVPDETLIELFNTAPLLHDKLTTLFRTVERPRVSDTVPLFCFDKLILTHQDIALQNFILDLKSETFKDEVAIVPNYIRIDMGNGLSEDEL
ncbi:hypothetical protein BDBG_17275 [Blastomyces gilchristii SLH14081]|uniref:Uncharacterized protein n=1 Tax=Blastomyces gilchristii (strain SLH14081) TaxID=559298 RepID=A0A179URY5_BLAGS|nr:uncharacterized protein BDBG_17275 [Blastomyces gilchristii SLH14081]OAT09827.1 hypothetical protein BDBG_17275 [Blastomyces gilchristii SLH14081]